MLLAVPLGLTIGACIGLLGGGGAVLAVPALVHLLGQDPHAATTTSLAVVLTGAAVGAVAHTQHRRVCWRHAAAFVPPAALGVVFGTVLNRGVGDAVLLGALVPILLLAAAATWRRAGRARRPDDDAVERCPPQRRARLAGAGLGTGVLTGFLGVGGGFVIVPVLTVGLGFPVRLAMGTSVAAIAALALLGLTAHLAAGASIDAGETVLLSVACTVGAFVAARQASNVPDHLLAGGFAVLVIAVAAGIGVSILT